MRNVVSSTSARAVQIPPCGLKADLTIPAEATGLVIFAHGSGSGRHSSRNRFVAQALNGGSLATLLLDLLTEQEESVDNSTRHLRFDIPMLADRLVQATIWAGTEPHVRHLPIGYFGASTGGGAALVATAIRPERIGAVVSRGGRPDLAGVALSKVRAPTLLIVGGEDHAVIEMNREAFDVLRCEKRMDIVPGATHLFEEPGTLAEVADLAQRWFRHHLNSEA